MLLSELANIVLLESGQFILGDMSSVRIDTPKFWALTKRWLAYYGKYKLHTSDFNLQVNMSHTFPLTQTDPITPGLRLAPQWISKAIPVGIGSSGGGANIYALVSYGASYGALYSDGLPSYSPMRSIYKYEKPTLYVEQSGLYDITAHYDRQYNLVLDRSGDIEEVDMTDITEADNKFIDLVVAASLIAIGRSRRAFTLSDLPVQNDSSEMVSDGQQLLQDTKEGLSETSDWHLSIGV